MNEPCPKCGGKAWIKSPGLQATEAVTEGAPEANGPQLLVIEAGKPFSGRRAVADLLRPLRGHVRVCDRFLGVGSLVTLRELSHCKNVCVLTRQTVSTGSPFEREIIEFRREHDRIEFRRHVRDDLHDRYILSADSVTFIGHGLADLGNRESMVIQLRDDLAEDAIKTLVSAFDRRWADATPIP